MNMSNNRTTNQPNDPGDDLKQSLLELHYGLLDDAEAGALRDRISQEPEVAEAWAQTLRLAGKLASAAKVETVQTPKLERPASDDGQSTHKESDARMRRKLVQSEPSPNGAVAEATKKRETRLFWGLSLGMLATAASVGFLIVGARYSDQLPTRPNPVVHMDAESVVSHTAKSDNEFQIKTSLLGGGGMTGSFPVVPASISFSILSENSVLFTGDTETNGSGDGMIEIPAELVIPDGAVMKVTASPKDGSAEGTSIEIPLEPTRCLTYLNIDRPVYRPGETVYFRSVTLNRRSLAAHVEVPIRYELIDPSGALVPNAFVEGVTDHGVGNGAFTIPSTAPGGAYTLVAKSLDGFFPDETKEFQIRAYRVPRFKKDLEFRRRSYGPGEMVEADFSAERAEGGAVAGAAVRVIARIDEEVVYQSAATTSAEGTLMVSFQLPEHITTGVGQLSVVVDDGGVQETQTKTIPIQLGRVEVDFYPEGGYLVDGLLNRVYFAARNTLGEPIHIKGEVLSQSGMAVAEIETVRDGMGRFEFIPRSGDQYSLKVTAPVDVTNSPKLPLVVRALPVLETGDGVFDSDEPISLNLRSRESFSGIVRAVCRGQLVGEKKVKFPAGVTSVRVPIRKDASGVIRVTVLDTNSVPAKPLVERLVFRRDDRQLNVSVVEDESALKRSPGEPLRLTLQVTDENDRPTPAVLGVSVVDDASLSMDETERPTLRTHFVLTSEVDKPDDLEHANFYLSDAPDAAESLDLLLGTQGWRRFVSGSPDQPNIDFREQLVRLFEMDGTNVDKPKPRISSSPIFKSRWNDYRVVASRAWTRFVHEVQLLVMVLVGIFMLLVLSHLRRKPASVVVTLLLIGSVSVMILGCGAQQNMVVQPDASAGAEMADEAAMPAEKNAAPTPNLSQAMEIERDGMDMAKDMGNMSKNELAMAMGGMGDDEASRRPQASMPADAPANTGAGGRPQPEFDDASDNFSSDESFVGVKREARDKYIADGKSIDKKKLQQLLASRGLDGERLADQLLDDLRFPVREYAHRYKKPNDGVRTDFTETLYWQPKLITDSAGKASIRFDLADSVTTFRVKIDGHTDSGRIGSGDAAVTSRIPFQIEPKLPLEVTTGDQIDLPVAVINATDEDISVNVEFKADRGLNVSEMKMIATSVGAGDRTRSYFTLDVGQGLAEQDVAIELRGVGGSAKQDLSDSIRRKLHIAPSGYPVHSSIAGVLNEKDTVALPIPNDVVAGSLAVTLRAYPSPMADIMAGVESILREPHGCFEQTSATNYPNTMALLYMKEHNVAKPDVSRRAMKLLDKGYDKLTSFECTKRGYEWFGKDPGHEALSAFGLMQFNDMQQVMPVDSEMVTRTRTWLMNRRDGKGGFNRNPRHLHVWSVQQEIVNAYVLWAITEADVATNQRQRSATELARELKQLNQVAKESDDAYLIALSAAALMNAKMTDEGLKRLDKLVTMQNEDGGLDGKTTVTSSGGISRKVETTAIATLAWLKSPKHTNNAKSAAKWLVSNRRGAGFGSTQATVLALKALVAMSKHSSSTSGGKLTVMLGKKEIGRVKLPPDPKSGSVVEIKGLGQHLDDLEGEANIKLVAKGTKNLSYAIDLAYNAITPESHESCPVQIRTEYRGDVKNVRSGDTIDVRATLENVTAKGQPMTVAIVGLPGGLEPKAEQLDEMRDAELFDYYELRGREVIFYWRTIQPEATKEIDFTVTAVVPGKYTAPASRAYLYYTAEQKHWTEPLKIEIAK